ncbi:hypothetical protein BDD12DRAFT_883702 [Trichophaea hybrida]|nr:hypothetical protein BDD12DRAFT_883702 [Trichophaea hybrida]
MTSKAAPSPPTTKIIEPYHVIEAQITQAINILHEQPEGGKPNIAAAARQFFVPEQRLRARWNGHRSKQDVIPANRKLREYQELAIAHMPFFVTIMKTQIGGLLLKSASTGPAAF